MNTAPTVTSVTLTEVARHTVLLRLGDRPLAHTLLCPAARSRRSHGTQCRVAPCPAALATDAAGLLHLPPTWRRADEIRVLAINPVGRVVARPAGFGAPPLDVSVAQVVCRRTHVGSWTSIPAPRPTEAAFDVLTALWDAFDRVLRHFTTAFRIPPRIIFPDRSPAVVAFVQPLSAPSGQPQMRLPAADPAGRAIDFTSTGGSGILAHELAHLLHFSHLGPWQRAQVGARYVQWLVTAAVRNGSPFHHTSARTSRTVAWLEAWGLCAERFYWYCREVASPDTRHTNPHALARRMREFIADELSPQPSLAGVMPGYVQVAHLHAGAIRQEFEADVVEGGVYGRAFLAAGRRTSLPTAVHNYLHQQIPH